MRFLPGNDWTADDRKFTQYSSKPEAKPIPHSPTRPVNAASQTHNAPGCNTTHRDGFNSMVQDALAGKIDLIITKSVSRFARNTVDSLTTIRKLKENGTECYFEKENI